MKLNLVLKTAEKQDYDFLLELRNMTMNPHIRNAGLEPTQELHRERINNHYDSAKLIIFNGVPIGLLKLVKEPQIWTLVQIQISPEFQRQGIGGLVLNTMLDDASEAGVSVALSVYKCNPALHLYQRLGFVINGETEKYYEMLWLNHFNVKPEKYVVR